MKITTILALLFSVMAKAQTTPCVPDTLLMNFLNSQNSYHFDSDLVDGVSYLNDSIPYYSFSSTCLNPAAKAKILSLLKGEHYNFEKELDEVKKDFYTKKSINYEIKYTFKGDTTRLVAKLDSLYRPIRAEQLASKQAEEYSEELIRFVGLIYFYEAIPYLKAEIKNPKRYAEIPKQELIKQTLARFGDIYWQNYYLKYFKKPSKNYREFDNKLSAVRYINNVQHYKSFIKTELNNNILGVIEYSDYNRVKSMWQILIDEVFNVNNEQLEKLRNQKFGKTIYDMYYSDEKINPEAIRKGLLEILEACKYDCLVDYSQKMRK